MTDPVSTSRRLLAGCALAPAAALALSLVLQHGFGISPCVWCVVQRAIYVLIIVLCALGAVLARRGGVFVCALAGLALSGVGLWAALFHNFVAARPGGCGVTIADAFLMATDLHEYVPWLFYPSAPCDEANAPLLGVPFALWSAALFTLIGAGSAGAAVLLARPLKASRGA